MSLRTKLDALRATLEQEAGATRDAVESAVGRLVSVEESTRPLKVGAPAPGFTLRAPDGVPVASGDCLRSGPLVVTFYRGLWCPYCQRDLQGLDDAATRLRELGATVLAVSRAREPGADTPSDHGLSLGFPVLEDASGDVAVGFGIRWSTEDARLIEEALGLGLTTFRGTEPWIVPMQARFVIARAGRVAFAEPAFSYDERSEPADLVPVLAELHRNR